MVNASKTANSLTIKITKELEVKIIASFSGKAMTIDQNNSPTTREVNNDTMVANLAPFALPAPSSFATRTLHKETFT
jgi:hypothetical protein